MIRLRTKILIVKLLRIFSIILKQLINCISYNENFSFSPSPTQHDRTPSKWIQYNHLGAFRRLTHCLRFSRIIFSSIISKNAFWANSRRNLFLLNLNFKLHWVLWHAVSIIISMIWRAKYNEHLLKNFSCIHSHILNLHYIFVTKAF